jgi:hypothetical protein
MFALIVSLAACRSTESSQVNAADGLTLESWTSACEADLAKSPDRIKSRTDLRLVSGSDDCASAYPKVKALLNEAVKYQAR